MQTAVQSHPHGQGTTEDPIRILVILDNFSPRLHLCRTFRVVCFEDSGLYNIRYTKAANEDALRNCSREALESRRVL